MIIEWCTTLPLASNYESALSVVYLCVDVRWKTLYMVIFKGIYRYPSFCSVVASSLLLLDRIGNGRTPKTLLLVRAFQLQPVPEYTKHHHFGSLILPRLAAVKRQQRRVTTTTTSIAMESLLHEAMSVTSSSNLPKVIIIAGPTATGKSDVAAIICRLMNGIVVSADSVQVYQKVQIGANKPTPEELQRTPHILLNLVNHTTPYTYSAAEWRRDAIFTIHQLLGNATTSSSNTTSEMIRNEMEMLSEQTLLEDLKRQEDILSTIKEAKKVKEKLDRNIRLESSTDSNDCSNSDACTATENPSSSYLPIVVGGTMMYLQWLVHGRPDAIRPTESALRQAKEFITQYQINNDNDWKDLFLNDKYKNCFRLIGIGCVGYWRLPLR
jgi:IPP transferase